MGIILDKFWRVNTLFRWFKDNYFDLNDKERPGQPKKFAELQLKVLINADQYQTQIETDGSCSKARKLGTIRIEAKIYRKKFSHIWITASTTKKERYFASYHHSGCKMYTLRYFQLHKIMLKAWPTIHINRKSNMQLSRVMLCIQCIQKGVVYSEILKPGQRITGDR